MDAHQNRAAPTAANAEIVAAFLDSAAEIRVRLSGFSMKPLIPSGSVVRFSSSKEPRVGDVVLLRLAGSSNDTLVAHRVLALDRETVWTKGDSSRQPDPPTPRSRMLGCATVLEIRGSTGVPLGNTFMRLLGLVLSKVYPRLVRTYRALKPRTELESREEASTCAH